MSRFDELREKMLLDVFDAATKANIDLSVHDYWRASWNSCAAEYEKLIAEKDAKLAKAVEALEFYAKPESIEPFLNERKGNNGYVYPEISMKFYDRARAALKEIEVE